MISHNDIVDALAAIRPGAKYALRGTELEWLDEAQTEPSAADIAAAVSSGAVPVPSSVTLAQARVALRRAGLFDAVQTAVQNAGGEVLDAWEYSNTVSRGSALVAALSVSLNLSPAQVDALFIAAESVTF